MAPFYGRASELEMLEGCYSRGGAVLIYGRRRIGKTYMIEHFCEGRRNLFLRCIKSSMSDNLEYFSQAVAMFRGTECRKYGSINDFFIEMAEICSESKTIMVLDEYQFLSRESNTIDSYTQHFIDSSIEHSDSMLILCGSSISAMRSLGADGGNPLFGRFRRIIEMKPMTFEECSEFHKGMPEADRLRLFLSIGGIPRYHQELNQATYRDCIVRNYLENQWMIEESQALVDSEFSNGKRISAELSSIANGCVSLKEISERIKEDDSACSKDLSNLCDIGIIGKSNPMLGAPKHPRYFIRDDLFAFHYEVVSRRRILISMANTGASFDALSPYIDAYLGKRFEYFCADLLVRSYPVTEIGTWWKGGKSGSGEEIDIVARLRIGSNNITLFAECKFTKAKAGFHELNVLDSRVEPFRRDVNERLMMFSVSGFEDDLAEFARGADVFLIGPEEIFGRNPMPPIGRLWIPAADRAPSRPIICRIIMFTNIMYINIIKW